mgnify:CR=1 FL=1
MPIVFDVDRAIFQWQVRRGKRMTYAELARQAGISLPTLHRMKNGDMLKADLRKVNEICKVLECEPGDLFQRVETADVITVEHLEGEHKRYQELMDRIRKSGDDLDA